MPETVEGQYRRVGGGSRKRGPRRKPKGMQGLGDLYDILNPDPFGNGLDAEGNPIAPEVGIIQSLIDKFRAAVAQLDDASARLDGAESNLLSIQSDVANSGDADAWDAWQTQYNKVIATQATRDSARNAITTVGDWIASTKHALGLSGLGVLPAIPWSLVAGIAAAAAAIYAIANAANTFFNDWQIAKWNAANIERQQQGLPALDGGPELADTGGGISGIFDSLSGICKYVVYGLLIYFVAGPLLESRR